MITEEMMAAAAAEMNETMLRSLPKPEDCQHEFSRKFERKMKRVIYRTDHPLQFRILQKVASVILVLFLGFATIMAISPTVRACVFGWIREQYESFITYYFVETDVNSTEPAEFYLDKLPDGYTEYMKSDLPDVKTTLYIDPDGKLLCFAYSRDAESAYFLVKEDGYYVEKVTIDDCIADFYLAMDPQNGNCLIWCESDTETILYLTGYLNKDELIALAKNVLKK